MKLSKILQNISCVDVSDCEISKIILDSRKTEAGSLFCAVKGHNIDARKFIPEAISNNVSAILADSDTKKDHVKIINDTQVIYIHNLNAKLSKIADNFYESPSKKTKIIGITGTNGKTTIAQIVANWHTLLNRKSATMGTIGNGFYDNLTNSENTTGNAFDVQENIYNYVNNKADAVTMEISSHGLVQNRVDSIEFDIAVFTNLTPDHLDYHKTMEDYFKAKALLFTNLNAKYKIINIGAPYGKELYDLIDDKDSIIVVSTKEKELEAKYKKYIYAKSVHYSNQGTYISFESNLAESVITTQLIGPFNASNCLMGLAVMFASGFNIQDIVHTSNDIKPVIGRMEVFKKQNKATIIVDYAHTPDALKKSLQASRIHTGTNLWCIFGCGGDRDKEKRPEMAKIAEQYADKIIITNDNPRTEYDEEIINDITAGLKKPDDVNIIKDRFEAIEYAFKNSKSKDIILVAGKGHEDYQIFGTDKIHYSDRESAKAVLKIKS